MDNNFQKKTCILCKKTIKRFSKWNDKLSRKVHRKCWLNFRDFDDRHFDYLFTGNYKANKSLITIVPTISIDTEVSK
jgi:hypothetical protein